MATSAWYLGHHFTKKITIRKRFHDNHYWFELVLTDNNGINSDITIYPDHKDSPIMWAYQDDKGDEWPFDPEDAAHEQYYNGEDDGQPDDLTEHQDFAQDQDPPEYL